MSRATVLRHVLLLQRDVPKAAQYYAEGLGLPLRVATDTWAELDAGGSTLALKHAPGCAPRRPEFGGRAPGRWGSGARPSRCRLRCFLPAVRAAPSRKEPRVELLVRFAACSSACNANMRTRFPLSSFLCCTSASQLRLLVPRSEAPVTTGYSPFLEFAVPDLQAALQRLLPLGAMMDGPIRFAQAGRIVAVRNPDGQMMTLFEAAEDGPGR